MFVSGASVHRIIFIHGRAARPFHASAVRLSGHNKWSKIRHAKGAADAERANLFSRLSNDIALAAKLGGPDAHFNIRLAACLASAKKADMPKSNIEAALNRGSGKGSASANQSLVYEGNVGPVGFMMDVLTDNKTRTIANIKSKFKKAGGAVSPAAFQFEHIGHISIHAPDKSIEEMEELAIEAGANDVSGTDGEYEFSTDPSSLGDVANAIKSAGFELLEAELKYAPKDYPSLNQDMQKQISDLIRDLEADGDIVKITSNAKLDENS